MRIWQSIRRLLGHAETPRSGPLAVADAEEVEPAVAEITVDALREALAEPEPPLVLDIREPFEFRQVRMPGARHAPMNSVPEHLGELPQDRRIVVICAHGSRSYSVTAWLMEQGYSAASLQGGLTQWAIRGGPVEQGAPK